MKNARDGRYAFISLQKKVTNGGRKETRTARLPLLEYTKLSILFVKKKKKEDTL